MNPDPKAASGHTDNPQSWNRYAYTDNNPMKFVDPDGLEKFLIIYVNQPIPHTRTVRTGLSNYGHAFIGVNDTTANTQHTFGFFPKSKWDLVGDRTASVEGFVNKDDNGDWNLNKAIRLTDDQFKKLAVAVNQDYNSPPEYNLETFNCVDWVLKMLKSIGMDIPTAKGADGSGKAHDNGDFGEDLRSTGGTFSNTNDTQPSSQEQSPNLVNQGGHQRVVTCTKYQDGVSNCS